MFTMGLIKIVTLISIKLALEFFRHFIKFHLWFDLLVGLFLWSFIYVLYITDVHLKTLTIKYLGHICYIFNLVFQWHVMTQCLYLKFVSWKKELTLKQISATTPSFNKILPSGLRDVKRHNRKVINTECRGYCNSLLSLRTVVAPEMYAKSSILGARSPKSIVIDFGLHIFVLAVFII